MANIITEEILDRLADKIANRINTVGDALKYGEIVRYKNCSVHFGVDKEHRDEFLIKSDNDNVAGEFKEVIRCNECEYHYWSHQNLWCDIYNRIMPEDGFCCFGEREL